MAIKLYFRLRANDKLRNALIAYIEAAGIRNKILYYYMYNNNSVIRHTIEVVELVHNVYIRKWRVFNTTTAAARRYRYSLKSTAEVQGDKL